MDNLDTILHRIRTIRKIKQRNIHDCAAFLNISKEHYLKFEQGSAMLSLPEIELLAHYFGVSPLLFFRDSHWENQILELHNDHVQPKYTSLRQKIIQTKIIREMKQKTLTIEQIHQATGIPISELNAYLDGKEPIPLNQLVGISQALAINPELLVDHIWLEQDHKRTSNASDDWQHEFAIKENQNESDQTQKNYLMLAIEKLSPKDKAAVAKLILSKLKTSTRK